MREAMLVSDVHHALGRAIAPLRTPMDSSPRRAFLSRGNHLANHVWVRVRVRVDCARSRD